MAVTIKDVEHVAALARLSFSDAEKERLMKELNEILNYMDQLNELDTSAVAPLAQMVDQTNVFRADVRRESLPREKALLNAPQKSEEFFKVPNVLGDR
jgi:aspartyl-tRNA(Asn)/glutamyl-tRNA(Gln) amidotransferase subunit C